MVNRCVSTEPEALGRVVVKPGFGKLISFAPRPSTRPFVSPARRGRGLERDFAFDANSDTRKQLSNAKQSGGVSVQGQSYLATFTLQSSVGATGAFNI